MRSARPARGFTLSEVLASALAAALLLCVLLTRAPHSRQLAAQSDSLANLRQLASIASTYGADHTDRVFGFSWTPTNHPTQYADLNAHAAQGPLEAAAAQAVDILRRRAGLPQFNVISNWIPHISYSQVVLADYLNTNLPLSYTISPEDSARRNAAATGQPPSGASLLFLASSSYELPPAFWSPDARTTTTGCVSQGGAYNFYQLILSGTGAQPTLGQRRHTEVQFPSSKVFMHDTAQWQGARAPVYFMYDHARIPLVMADGSASVRVQSTANPGFQPSNPTAAFGTTTTYNPNPSLNTWDPPVIGGVTTVSARYRFTRWGLRGRDFDGEEVTAP